MVWGALMEEQNLHEMGNYSSLMGIIAGLNLTAVGRLEYTLGCVHESKKKLLEQFEKLMHPSNSYKRYRNALKACPLPLVPYL